MLGKLLSNPFAVLIIILHLGAGIWSSAKADVFLALYYFAGAVLNMAVILK
jgi:hypothetical protein